MPKALLSDEDFIVVFEEYGATETARRLGMTVRPIFARRADLEARLGREIKAPTPERQRGTTGVHRSVIVQNTDFPHIHNITIETGSVIVFSDAHYWTGPPSTAHRAVLKFCKMMKNDLVAVIANGDILDGARISKHAPIGWESRPTLIQELESVKERMGEIEKATKGVAKIWNLGNHDSRFETRLATVAPEYAQVHGVHLKDHFSLWDCAWRVDINDDCVVKHRFKSGIHAPHNNTMWAGKTIVTGHLHSAKIMPITDYNGTRWGVDTGCLAEPTGPQFTDYTEANPTNWRSGFGVLSYHEGRLLWPELVTVHSPGRVEFRGKVWDV